MRATKFWTVPVELFGNAVDGVTYEMTVQADDREQASAVASQRVSDAMQARAFKVGTPERVDTLELLAADVAVVRGVEHDLKGGA